MRLSSQLDLLLVERKKNTNSRHYSQIQINIKASKVKSSKVSKLLQVLLFNLATSAVSERFS